MVNAPQKVNILGVQVACLSMKQLLDYVQGCIAAGDGIHTILYANAHCLNVAYQDAAYLQILNQSDLVLADGVSMVWGSRALGGCRLEKLTAVVWLHNFCQRFANSGWRVYILAGRPGVAEQARINLARRYPGLNFVGCSDGFFDQKGQEDVLQEIALLSPQVVFVGMGTPLQEKWLAANRVRIAAPLCWASGALFDYVAGLEKRAPDWVDALGMEWFWRLLEDPKGKWRRYIIGNPVFIYRVLCQRMRQ
jgi:N-acetylglucosaminyldiphosphoundecaprenol N-acetyl-beta-D-mannosaminyltransferase